MEYEELVKTLKEIERLASYYSCSIQDTPDKIVDYSMIDVNEDEIEVYFTDTTMYRVEFKEICGDIEFNIKHKLDSLESFRKQKEKQKRLITAQKLSTKADEESKKLKL